MRQRVVHCCHDIEIVRDNLRERCHVGDEEGNIQSAALCLMHGASHRCLAQVRRGYLMAEFREPNGLRPNPACAVQNLERSAGQLCRQKRVENPRLTLDGPLPIVKNQMVMGCKRFIKAKNRMIQKPSSTPCTFRNQLLPASRARLALACACSG